VSTAGAIERLVLVANARLPSERAQALQVVQASASFARAGVATTLIHARRKRTLSLPPGMGLFDFYGVPPGARPALESVPCLDWIDQVPRALQYWPARLQELTFARGASRRVRASHASAWVLTRELEVARALTERAPADAAGVFLELHRVPLGAVRRRWLLRACQGCCGVLAISGGVREDLLELGCAPQRVGVEHDAFEPARLLDLPPRQAARAELGLASEVPLVAYTGSLLEWKGADVLVEAARSLPQVSFVIAGGASEDVQRLRRRAADLPNVRIDGFQPPARVGLYLAAADLGVVPNRARPAISARYTSPLKVFESFAAGLPLVASDLPSLRELIPDGEHGLLVPPEDPAALARGIVELLADPARRARIARRTRERAQAHTWDERARRILAWMAELSTQRNAAHPRR
jgi:glycosyltransferase involved in cell wall biosynthesis